MSWRDGLVHGAFYSGYLSHVVDDDLVAALRREGERTQAFLRQVPPEEETRLHEGYGWTFRQVVGHVIDGERVFGYRALRIGRGDTTPLASYDEMLFAANAPHARIPLARLAEELAAVRAGTVLMLAQFDEADWARRGETFGGAISLGAAAAVMLGHERHHVGILRRRLERAKK